MLRAGLENESIVKTRKKIFKQPLYFDTWGIKILYMRFARQHIRDPQQERGRALIATRLIAAKNLKG